MSALSAPYRPVFFILSLNAILDSLQENAHSNNILSSNSHHIDVSNCISYFVILWPVKTFDIHPYSIKFASNVLTVTKVHWWQCRELVLFYGNYSPSFKNNWLRYFLWPPLPHTHTHTYFMITSITVTTNIWKHICKWLNKQKIFVKWSIYLLSYSTLPMKSYVFWELAVMHFFLIVICCHRCTHSLILLYTVYDMICIWNIVCKLCCKFCNFVDIVHDLATLDTRMFLLFVLLWY